MLHKTIKERYEIREKKDCVQVIDNRRAIEETPPVTFSDLKRAIVYQAQMLEITGN